MAKPEDGLSVADQQVLLSGKRHWLFFLQVTVAGVSWNTRERLENAGLLEERSYRLTPEGRRARGRLQIAQMNANLGDHDSA